MRFAIHLAISFLLIFVLYSARSLAEERRVALVLGNGNYSGAAHLQNTLNDATGLAEKLMALDFDVTLLVDLDRRSTIRAIDDFSKNIVGADLALFYYAGHGVQIAGRNYLLPLDVDVTSERALQYTSIDINEIVNDLERLASSAIVILDSCRDNPFVEKISRSTDASRSVGLSRGLGPIVLKGHGTIIAYSASAGKVASDGDGAHSPYTAALLEEIDQPGVEVGLMFRRVAARVIDQTGGAQRPEMSVRLTKEIYLNSPLGASTSKTEESIESDGLNNKGYEETVKRNDVDQEPEVEHPPEEEQPPVTEFVSRQPQDFPIGKWPEGIVVADGSIWIAESGQRSLARIDPETGDLLSREKVGRLPVGLAVSPADELYVAVATDKVIWKRVSGSAKGKKLAKLDNYPQAIAADRDGLWALVWIDGSSSRTRVTSIDPGTGRKSYSADLPKNGFDMAVTESTLWTLHRYDGQDTCELIAVDKHSLQELYRVPFVGFTSFLAADTKGVFAAGGEFGKSGLIVKIDPELKREVARYESNNLIRSIALANEFLVAVDVYGDVFVFSTSNLSLLRRIKPSMGEYEPRDLLVSENKLFITTHQGQGANGSVIVIENWRPE